MKKSALLFFLAGTSALTAMPAYAQDAGAASIGLEEIVVTAQRREENLQRVPVAVTAIGADDLDQLRVTNIKDLQGLAPNLQLNTQGLASNPTVNIRGVSSGVSNNAVDPKVGIYLDGVYIGRTVGSIFDLADIGRVEVLRGPQGTLFGRNATGGALSLTSQNPTGEFGVKGSLSVGSDEARRAKFSLNLPEFGPFSARISYLHDEIEGDTKNSIGGETIDLRPRAAEWPVLKFADRLGSRDVDGVQLAVRGDFDKLVADYRFDYTDSNNTGRAMQNLGLMPADSLAGLVGGLWAFTPAFGGTANESLSRLDTVANGTSEEHVETWGHSLTLAYKLNDAVTLKSISAFRGFTQDPNIYDLGATGGIRFSRTQLGTPAIPAFGIPGSGLLAGDLGTIFANPPGPNDYTWGLLTSRSTKQKQFTQEFQVQVEEEKYNLTAGVFYFHENSPAVDILGIVQPIEDGVVVVDPLLDSIFGSGTTRTRSINDSLAGYAQGTYHITDQWDVTAGFRYTEDERESTISEVAPAQGALVGLGAYKQKFNKTTFNGVLAYKPTQDVTGYVKVSTGYVAGGLLSGIPYDPETLTAYEAGVKSQLFDNRLRANVAVFYSDYKDLQIQNFLNGVQTFENAGKAALSGFEVELVALPMEGLTLEGNVGYTDTNYKEFITTDPRTGLRGDVSDIARTTYKSDWTARIGAAYEAKRFGNGMYPFIRGDANWRSDYALTALPLYTSIGGPIAPINEEGRIRPSYWVFNGRLGVADIPVGNGMAALSLFGNNIFDKDYIAFGTPVAALQGSYERGATYGVELGFEF
jgi:iron complex outermembrane receptor protein